MAQQCTLDSVPAQTVDRREKELLLVFRCEGGNVLTSPKAKKTVTGAGWTKVANLQNTYKRVVKDGEMDNVITELDALLGEMKREGKRIWAVVSMMISLNSVGDPAASLQKLFN